MLNWSVLNSRSFLHAAAVSDSDWRWTMEQAVRVKSLEFDWWSKFFGDFVEYFFEEFIGGEGEG